MVRTLQLGHDLSDLLRKVRVRGISRVIQVVTSIFGPLSLPGHLLQRGTTRPPP